MGKDKKQKQRGRAGMSPLPTESIASVAVAADAVGGKAERSLPIVTKLQSPDANDRAWAAASCAHLSADKTLRRTLLAQNVVGWLIQCLSDPSKEVAVEAAGALQNLSAVDDTDGAPAPSADKTSHSGADICAEMYRKDVLTPVIALIREIHATLKTSRESLANAPSTSKKAPKQQPTSDQPPSSPAAPEHVPPVVTLNLAENLVSLVWNLCESSDKALKLVSADTTIIPFLVDVFDFAQIPVPDGGKKTGTSVPLIGLGLVRASANCLASISEDNSVIEGLFKSNQQWFSALGNWARGNVKLFQGPSTAETIKEIAVLTCSILYNVRKAVPSSGHLELLDLIAATSSHCIDVSLASASASAAVLEPPTPASPPSASESRKHHDVSISRLVAVAAELRAAQSALELISNVCSSKDAPLTPAAGGNVDDEWQDDDDAVEEDAPAYADGAADDTMDVEGDDAMDDAAAAAPAEAGAAGDGDGGMASSEEEDDDVFADADEAGDSSTTQRGFAGDPRFLAILKAGVLEKLFRHVGELASGQNPPASASIPSPPASESEVTGRSEVDDHAVLKDQVTKALQELPGRVISAVGNVFLVATWAWIREHEADVSGLWKAAWVIARSEVDRGAHHVDTIESAVVCLCVVMSKVIEARKKLAADNASPNALATVLPFSQAEVELLIRIFGGIASLPSVSAERLDSIRCKCLATLTLLAGPVVLSASALSDADVVAINRTVGDFVMSVVEQFAQTGAAWGLDVLSEALDLIFDVYGDISYRYDKPVFVRLNYLGRLKQVYGALRAKVKSVDKRNPAVREARFRADGALINLNAFIKYKEKEQKSHM